MMMQNYQFLQTDNGLIKPEPGNKSLKDYIDTIDENINNYVRTYKYYDILGQFYIEFLRYSNADIIQKIKSKKSTVAFLNPPFTGDEIRIIVGTGNYYKGDMVMKAQMIKQFGDTSVLHMVDMDIPQPSENQVLLKMRATSVNPIDTKIRAGLLGGALPMVLHSDFAGEIVTLGDGVESFAVGDAVYGCCGAWGGGTGVAAEYAVVDARLIAHAPKNIALNDCAVIPLVALTAVHALQRLDVKPDDTLCVQSATGGVGYMATQIAIAKGAKVVGITSDDAKARLLADIGAIAINRTTQDPFAYAEQRGGFDKIFNTVGTESLDDAFQMARAYGTIVGIAGRSDHNLGLMHMKNLTLSFVFLRASMANPEHRPKVAQMLTEIAKWVEQGTLKPAIHTQRFTLATLGDAHACLQSGQHKGKKIVVDIAE